MFALRTDYRLYVDELVAQLVNDDAINVVLIPHTYRRTNADAIEMARGAGLEVSSAFPAEQHHLKVIAQEVDQHHNEAVIAGCGYSSGGDLWHHGDQRIRKPPAQAGVNRTQARIQSLLCSSDIL